MTASRRSFLRSFVGYGLGTSASLALSRVSVAESPMLSESAPPAQKLGYKQDASSVDKTKFTNYSAGQECSTCSLYQGKPGDPSGGCTLFGTRLVAAHGWCSSYSNF